jgi:hypothetical protein
MIRTLPATVPSLPSVLFVVSVLCAPAVRAAESEPTSPLAGRPSGLKPGAWGKLRAVLTDRTQDAGLSTRSWNNLRYDPSTGRFYVWEGWCARHSDPRYGFPYTPRRYHIYSDALFSFAVPESPKGGTVDLELEAISCWRWAAGKKWTLRDPARDHPKMKTPSPKDRHPFNSTAFDTRRRGLWQFGGVNMGGGIGWLSDLWFYDLAKGEWKERKPDRGPRVAGAAGIVYVPKQDVLFTLVQAPGKLGVWQYHIEGNKWGEITGHEKTYRLDWRAIHPVYHPGRKRCFFFSRLATAEKDEDGKPKRVLHLFTYDPATRTMEAGEPVRSPEGYAGEMTVDAKRDRLLCLRPSGGGKTAPMGLWAYDFGANAFQKLTVGGTPPPRQSGAPCTLAWDEKHDLYVVWRSAAVYLLRPQTQRVNP